MERLAIAILVVILAAPTDATVLGSHQVTNSQTKQHAKFKCSTYNDNIFDFMTYDIMGLECWVEWRPSTTVPWEPLACGPGEFPQCYVGVSVDPMIKKTLPYQHVENCAQGHYRFVVDHYWEKDDGSVHNWGVAPTYHWLNSYC